ncbi:MAG: 4-hydroxy-tetrahydrodipicolinate synthase [Bacteroidia bacterium]
MPSYSMFKGTGVAMVTPFTKQGNIDYTALGKLTNHLINGKLEYLVVLGTTGESATLSKDEKRSVLQCVLDANQKHLPVVLGVGGNNTAEVISGLDAKHLTGVDAILSVTPFYNRPNQEGLYAHYKAVSENSPLPVILYNVPTRTGVNMTAETQLRLANDFKNIVATKEASGNIEQITNIIQHKPEDFLVISGDDPLTLPLMACGADGLISVVGNAFPKQVSEMVRMAMKNKMNEARKLHYSLSDITKLMFTEGSPAGVKEVLQHLGICGNTLRLPLTNVSHKIAEQIGNLTDSIIKTESVPSML